MALTMIEMICPCAWLQPTFRNYVVESNYCNFRTTLAHERETWVTNSPIEGI